MARSAMNRPGMPFAPCARGDRRWGCGERKVGATSFTFQDWEEELPLRTKRVEKA